MKKAVFFGAAQATVHGVYSTKTRDELHSFLEFETDHVIQKNEMEQYKDILSRAEYIFSTWGMPHMTKEEIHAYLPSLKAVFYGAGSVQGFAREFIEKGIEVYSAWAANGVPVAEFTFAEITLATKGYYTRFHRPEEGDSWRGRALGGYSGAYDIKVGILGAGVIGKMVIERLKTLSNIEILVFDPFLPDEWAEEHGVTKTDLETIFSECTVVSNHLANNKNTVGMINKKHFALMKPYTTFINTGRGAQVVEADMIEMLENDETKAAVLDVTYPEPPVHASPLYSLRNVFLTPHIAGSLGNEVRRMGEYMLAECRSLDAGEKTRYSVSLKMLETMA